MSKRWLVILLLVSVAFNLAVFGSFVYLHYLHPQLRHCPPPSPHGFRPDRDSPGKPLRDRLLKDEQFKQSRKEFLDSKLAFMEELVKEDFDEAVLRKILEESLVAQGAMERRIGDQMIELRKTMTAEEAREFCARHIERMRQRHPQKLNRYRRFK